MFDLGHAANPEESFSCGVEKELLDHEENENFTLRQDELLVHWVNRKPDDWRAIACGVTGGIGTVFGWGHNHRGQLGGIGGSKVKEPTVCETITALRPVQIQGGEQTLFCVTSDGKVRIYLVPFNVIIDEWVCKMASKMFIN